MKKCALLTMNNLGDFIHYDHLLEQPLNDSRWNFEYVSWRDKSVNWDAFDAVIIRSPWDYQDDYKSFIQALKSIEKSSATLLNSLSTVEWNIDKQYLIDLENKGVEIVPTYWLKKLDYEKIDACFELFKTNQMVVKPTISANADNTHWIKKNQFSAKMAFLNQSVADKQFMVQPFIPSVIEVGEYSMFYFAGKFSHCVLKTPKSGDFRVQEEFGSSLKSLTPSQDLILAGEAAINAIPEPVLYARVDLVEYQNSYRVMELELIEPSLYFNLDKKAPARFVAALNQWMK